jgi:ADP-heptose:LPS heptosyltransferase
MSVPTRRQVRSILVIKLDKLGDIILASPFFRELRRNFPEASITAITSVESDKVMQSCPYVCQTIPVSVNPLNIFALRRFAQSLKARASAADLTLVPRYSVDLYGAGWISFFSGAPMRLGFSESADPRKARVNRGADALFTDTVSPNGVKHEVERNLDLLRHLNLAIADTRLEMWFSESEKRTAESMLAKGSNTDALLIAVGLGASQAKRMWPVERYADVCRKLHSMTGARFVAMGSPAEIPALNRFRERVGEPVAVFGTVSLGTVAAIFSRCSLFLGSDSAQKHIAAAVGVPVVEISCHASNGDPAGENSPVRFHAWGVPQVVLQPLDSRKPCRAGCQALAPHCILEVSVSDVERSAISLLTSARPVSSVRISV